jgi:hypothetical protein
MDKVIIGLCLLLVGAFIYASVLEERNWQAFKISHSCKVVGQATGDWITGFGIGAKGETIVTTSRTPDKTGWLCNDGVTYWR